MLTFGPGQRIDNGVFWLMEVRRCGRDWTHHEVAGWHSPLQLESSSRTTFGQPMLGGRSCQRSFVHVSNQFTKLGQVHVQTLLVRRNKYYISELYLAEHYRVV